MTDKRFIKFIPSTEAMYLLTQKGHAFRLLTIIAEAARRYSGDPDGLEIGEAFIGDWKSYGMTEQNYRTAKRILVQRQHLKILETNRTRKKSTTGVTTEGTKVKILSSTVYDINTNSSNDRSNDCPTTAQRLPNDELRKNKKDKKEKEKIKKEKPIAAALLTEFFDSLLLAIPSFNPTKIRHTEAQLSAITRLKEMYGEDKVRAVFSYAHKSDFWRAHVHTAVYLERKFETLTAQMLSPEKPKINGNHFLLKERDRRTTDIDGNPVENQYKGKF